MTHYGYRNKQRATVIILFGDSATKISSDNQHDLFQEESDRVQSDTSLELELPCGEPVEMVYGGVSLPGIAFGAGHPVHQRGEKVESVTHGANDQA